MIRLRRLAIVLMAVGLITSAIYATGAFTNITAQRDANIRVAGDGGSYLSLQPANGSNGAYATQRGGQLRVSLGGALGEGGGAGVNRESLTVVRDVFTITNKGAQSLGVWVTDSSEAVTFEGGKKERTLEGKQQAVSLKPGDSVTVGLTIDTRQHKGDSVIKSVQIHADSDVSGAPAQGGTGDNAGRESASGPRGPSSASKNTGGTASPPPTDSKTDKKSSDRKRTSADSSSGSNGGSSAADDVKNAVVATGKAIAATIAGFSLGGMGMPGRLLSVKQSSSPFYLLGQLITVFAPTPVGVVADLRDIGSNVANGKALAPGTILTALGLIPAIGSATAINDVRKVTQDWISAFPSKADDVVRLLADPVIKRLPSSLGAKLLGAITDVPASKLNNKGVPMDDILKYSDEGVNYQRVLDLRSKGFSAGDIRGYVDKGVDLKRVERLRNGGLPPRATKYVIAKGADPQQINKLRSQDVPVGHILHFFDEGADLKKVNKLRSQGVPSAEIKQYVNRGADLQQVSKLWSDGVSKGRIRSYVDAGANLKQVNKLRSQGISDAEIDDYVDEGLWLKGVSKLRKNGASPELTKRMLKIIKTINEGDKKGLEKITVKMMNKKLGSGHRISKSTLEILKATVAHKGWKDARQDSSSGKKKQPIRRSIQTF